MATTYTTNLRLAVNSNLTAEAKANLAKIDNLGATFVQDSASNTLIRSIEDIYLTPNDPSAGGSGVGGSLFVGSSGHSLDEIRFYSAVFNTTSPVGTLDQASGGTKYLQIKYNSTLSGSVDTAADRSLSIDLEGSNRNLILGTNLSVSATSLQLGTATHTLPAASSTLVDLDDSQTLTNKSMSGSSNSFSNISYSSLSLSNSIVNADINSSASIAYSKLNLTNGVINADINSGAAIAYSKLNLSSSIVNADINASASIVGTKISPDFGSQSIRTTGQFQLAKNASIASTFIANSGQVANINYTLPAAAPTSGQVLVSDGSANLTWSSVGSGTVTSVAVVLSTELDSVLYISGSPITTSGNISLDLETQSANKVFAGPATGIDTRPTFRSLVSDDIPSLLSTKISDFNAAWDSRLTLKTTTNLAEGTNLYYTDGRVDTRLATYKYTTTWSTGDGTSKAITHSLGTTEVSWSIFDIDSGEELWPDTATRTGSNTMTFTSSEAPAGSGWRIIVRK